MANTPYAHYVSGLTDLKVTKLDGSAQEDMDAAQEMTVTIVQSEAELEGDDTLKATKSSVKNLEGSISGGAVSVAALGIMFGITPPTTGVTPNRVTTLSITQGMRLPYFKASGMAYDDQTGALQVICHKVKLSGDIDITLEQGTENWLIPEFEFKGVANDVNKMVDFILQETATALPTS